MRLLFLIVLLALMNCTLSFLGHLRCVRLTSHMKATKLSRSMRTKIRAMNIVQSTSARSALTTKNNNTSLSSISVTFEGLLKKYKEVDAHKKVLQTIEEHGKSGQLNQTRTFLAMKTLSSMRMQEDLPFVVDCWLRNNGSVDTSLAELNTTVSMIRFCCIQKNIESVEKLTSKLGFIIECDVNKRAVLSLTDENFEIYAKLLADLSLGYVSMGKADKASAVLRLMKEHSMIMDKDVARKILKEYTLLADTQNVRRCLSYLIDLTNGLDDPDCVQIVNNLFIRSIDFVTGAVSMATLPPPLGPEVCFIGRSNVGKSSLINTICNRKSVAYTSKKPGKTAEFNYFDAKGVVGPNKEPHQFYLVDMPGVGYALRSRALRDNWTNLLRDYVENRPTLRVVFHLVDSRHGLMDSDEECLSLLENLPSHVLYVVVLTKVDKQRGMEKELAVQEYVVEKIYSEIAKRTDRVVPLLFTSSSSKLGVATLWSTLLDGIHRIVPKDKSTE